MIAGIDNLEALPATDWPKVRDISIPLRRGASGKLEADLQGAVCFASRPHAYRLCDTADATLLNRAVQIVSAAQPSLDRKERRFRLTCGHLSFRAQIGDNADGMDLQLRVLPEETPSLGQLHLPAAWRAVMLDEGLINGGLVLLTAPSGQGKTTTASAMVRTRLEYFGGQANTIEDPIELPLQRVWGTGGICYQRPVNTLLDAEHPGDGYHRAMVEALRQFPAIAGGNTILMVGEIRDARTAAETLKAACNGHLVIATMHAKSAETAVRRIMTLATDTDDGMRSANVREMLSESLRCVFNQRLKWALDQEGWSAGRIDGDLLWSDGYDSEVAAAIRAGGVESLLRITRAQTTAARATEDSADEGGATGALRDAARAAADQK